MDAAAESGPVIRLLAHYHSRLLANPTLCAQLERLGLATRATIAEHRLGFVDRTAQRALLPRSPRDAAVTRTAWIAEGFLLRNGRERLRGCLVVPLPGTSTAIGARSKSRTGHPIWELVAPSGAPDALLFTPPAAAHARELGLHARSDRCVDAVPPWSRMGGVVREGAGCARARASHRTSPHRVIRPPPSHRGRNAGRPCVGRRTAGGGVAGPADPDHPPPGGLLRSGPAAAPR